MPRPLAVPVRRTVIRLWEQGHSAARHIAQAFGVACSTVHRLIRGYTHAASRAFRPRIAAPCLSPNRCPRW